MKADILRRPGARWLAAGLLLAGGIAGTAVVLAGGGSERASREWVDEIPQTAEADDSGIQLRALGAIFSGSETVVRLKASLDGQVLGTSPMAEIHVPRGAVTGGGFAGSLPRSARNSDGDLLVFLPAVDPSRRGDSMIALQLGALEIADGPNVRRVSGEWALELSLPSPTPDRYVTERATGVTEVGGAAVEASMLRSASQTIVEYTVPAGMISLATPSLVVEDGSRLAPYETQVDGDQVVAYFNQTDFGSTVTFEMGAVALVDDSSPEVVGVRVAAAFNNQQVPMSPGQSVTVRPDDVAYGDESLAYTVSIGEYAGREWVELLVPGSWHPESSEPKVVGSDGEELALAHVQVQYQKDGEGTVRPGTTRVAAFFDDSSQLSLVAFGLTGEARVLAGPSRVELAP